MKILLWTIGKPHEPYVKAGIEDFTGRVSRYFPVEWRVFPVPRHSHEDKLKKAEGDMILQALGSADQLVLLEEKGRMLDSEQLAVFIQQKANNSTDKLVFLIGGAYGVDGSVMKRANFKWSLSALTFPHQLVRLILIEQLYRACSILRNEKYHHR
jgi:23S rRNA (pseudouridine1915-N3)-methyltransferase